MTSASQFFTTLAQLTAISIGFATAFASALYTIRRNRIREQSQNIITKIESFIKEYRPQLESLNKTFEKSDLDDPRSIEGTFYSGEHSDDIKSWAEEQSNVVEALAWGNVYWTLRLFDDIIESSEPDNVFQYFDLLSYSVNNLQDARAGFPNNRELFEFPPEMKKDYDQIASMMYNLKSKTRKSKIGPVILKSKILFFVGVVVPVSLLLSVPEPIAIYNLTGTTLFLLQIVNFGLVVVVSWGIFTDLQNLMTEELF